MINFLSIAGLKLKIMSTGSICRSEFVMIKDVNTR